jgi:ribosomal protein S18 acetylase RimI-like enzyme
VSLSLRPFQPKDEDAAIRLWKDCGLVAPQNDPHQDIARKLKVQPELFLVALAGNEVIGTVMAGYEGHRGWINYLAVAPGRRKTGLGRRLMEEAETRLRALGCPKINLQVRETNADARAFYERIGYRQDPVTSYGKRLVQD